MGVPIEYDAAEVERDRLEAEARERRHQAELKAREAMVEQSRREQEARDAMSRAELPEAFRDL